jgi:hypothetical protein
MSMVGTPTGVYAYGFYPSDPYIGMCIFDSTYGNVLHYYGPTLGWQVAWNLPWGLLAEVILGTNFGVPLPEGDITGLILSWNGVKNRRYLAQMQVVYGSVPESVGTTVALADTTNTHTQEALQVYGSSGNQTRTLILTERILCNTAGTLTRKGRAGKTAPADTKNVYAGTTIRIYDTGAFGAPTFT